MKSISFSCRSSEPLACGKRDDAPGRTSLGAESSEGESARPWDFGPEGANFYSELEIFERRMITRALHLARGSKREAARLLQVNRTTLLEKLTRRGWETDKAAFALPPNANSVPETGWDTRGLDAALQAHVRSRFPVLPEDRVADQLSSGAQ